MPPVRSPLGPVAVAAITALPLAQPAAAQEAFVANDFVLEEIVISANRVPTPLAATGASVAVLTEEDIAASGATQLSVALALLPGVSVAQSGPPGASSILRIRGADWRYIAVFVDGIRVDDPSLIQTAFDFGHMTAGDIARVELLRGSQSALWGGSAVAGVINITTRASDEPGLTQSYGIEGGSYGTGNLRYGFTQRWDRGVLAFNLTHTRSDGFSAADEADGNTQADGFESTRASVTFRHAVSDTLSFGAAAFVQDSRAEYDGFDAVGPVDRDNRERRRQAGGRLFAEFSEGASTHLLELTAYSIRRRANEENAFPPPARDISVFRGERFGLGYQGTTEAAPGLTLVYGADWMRETARYAALPSGRERTEMTGVFGQALWAPRDDLDIAFTLRGDRNSRFGSFGTGRVALAWRPAEGAVVRAVAATGFRPPSIDERFGVYGAFVGNPDLTPEKSRSFELGGEYTWAGGARVSATAFRLDVRNLITAFFDFDPITGLFFGGYANEPGTSRRQGVELEASLPLGTALTLDAGYTYTSARNADGARLARVPRHDLTLGVSGDITERLSGRLTVQHVGDRIDGFPLGRMPDYTVVHGRLAWALDGRTELSLRVENLFDKQYQTVAGYGTAGRSFYVGISGRF